MVYMNIVFNTDLVNITAVLMGGNCISVNQTIEHDELELNWHISAAKFSGAFSFSQ